MGLGKDEFQFGKAEEYKGPDCLNGGERIYFKKNPSK